MRYAGCVATIRIPMFNDQNTNVQEVGLRTAGRTVVRAEHITDRTPEGSLRPCLNSCVLAMFSLSHLFAPGEFIIRHLPRRLDKNSPVIEKEFAAVGWSCHVLQSAQEPVI
jgi:hypothetical protein